MQYFLKIKKFKGEEKKKKKESFFFFWELSAVIL